MPISKQIATTAKEDVQDPMLLAVKSYTKHLEAGHRVSFRACANKFGVSRETLRQRIAGRRTRKEANDDMAWFTPEEDQVLIGFLKEIAEHGFPDTKRYLRECVNALLRSKKGDPTFSVGINWVDHAHAGLQQSEAAPAQLATKPMKRTRKRHVMKRHKVTDALEGPVLVSTQAARPRRGVVRKNYCEDLDFDDVP